MANNQSVDNNLKSAYTVETIDQGSGVHRQVVHVGSGATSGTEYDAGDATPGLVSGGAIIFDDGGTLRNVSDTNPLPITGSLSIGSGFSTFTPAKVSVSNVATAILGSADSGRTRLRLINLSTTITVYLKIDNTVDTDDFPLRPGVEMNFDGYTQTLYGITASSTADVRILAE